MSGVEPHRGALVLPSAALRALRELVLDEADGAQRLRDAGYAVGVALFDDFAATTQSAHRAAPAALPLGAFAAALAEYLSTRGWGTARVTARPGASTIRVHATDWLESDGAEPSSYPSCHFSTGALAGCFGRAAGRPLAVLEVACRTAGADRCEFAIGSRAVLDALCQALRERSA